jgi:hypothetical protein
MRSEVSTAVKINTVFFRVMKPFSIADGGNGFLGSNFQVYKYFNPEDGNSKFLRNITYLHVHTTLLSIKTTSVVLPP